jgi:hypothetical protein
MEGFVEGADAISGKDENTFVVFKDAEENCDFLDIDALPRESRINLILSCSLEGQISCVLQETHPPHPAEVLCI